MTEIDTRIFLFLHDALSGRWILPMVVLSAIGGGWGALAVLPFFASMRTRRFAASLAVVLAATSVLVFALKHLIARTRPYAALKGVKALFFNPPTDYSFPSGHSAGSFAFAVFVAIILIKTAPAPTPPLPSADASDSDAMRRERLERAVRFAGAVLLVLLATGVGLSRIALGVHFPGDVVAGAVIGGGIARVGATLYFRSSGASTDANDP